MKMIVRVDVEVNIEGDRVNGNEVFDAVTKVRAEVGERLGLAIVEAYQEKVVEVLCSPSGLVAKKGLGGHEAKGREGHRCRGRRFRRAGSWSDDRTLRGEVGDVTFRPAVVECAVCGKKVTPVLGALELEPYEGRTEGLLRRVVEAVAEASYRRGSAQLGRLAEIPVAKSTAHQWVADVELPVSESSGLPFLGADGTGFKLQPGRQGEVRMVLELGEEGEVRPLGVWAGTDWKTISEEVRACLKGQARLLVNDGEQALEEWLGQLAEATERCHWHLPRGAGYALWEDEAPLEERRDVAERLRHLLAIEIPEGDVEFVSAEDKEALRKSIEAAEDELGELCRYFVSKGYHRAATYLSRARKQVFNHLRLWLETGIVAPRTTSILENIIRELVHRLKKLGWNWSDPGAARMGRIMLLRRFDPEAWEEYWRKKMNLQGRCQISIIHWEVRRVA
jgi:hypothetical protein